MIKLCENCVYVIEYSDSWGMHTEVCRNKILLFMHLGIKWFIKKVCVCV